MTVNYFTDDVVAQALRKLRQWCEENPNTAGAQAIKNIADDYKEEILKALENELRSEYKELVAGES